MSKKRKTNKHKQQATPKIEKNTENKIIKEVEINNTNDKIIVKNKFDIINIINTAYDKREYKKSILITILSCFLQAILICNIIYEKLNKNPFSFHRITFSNSANLCFSIVILNILFTVIYLTCLFYFNKYKKYDIRIYRCISSIGIINIFIIPIMLFSIIIYHLFNVLPIFSLLAVYTLYTITLFYVSNKVTIQNENYKFITIFSSYFISLLVYISFLIIILKDFFRIFEILV